MISDPEHGDGVLLDRFRSGDGAAFELLVGRYQGPLLRFAGSLLRDNAAAEDIVQEAFLRLMRSAPDVGSNGACGPWLFRVCRNLSYDMIKTETREKRRREKARTPAEAPAPSAGLEKSELHDALDRELQQLPAREREVLQLKVHEGLSYSQIAEVTGLASGTIGWLVHTALTRLTDRLQAARVL